MFEIQNAFISSFLKSTLHRSDHIPSRNISKQAPKIIKRKGIKAWLGVLAEKEENALERGRVRGLCLKHLINHLPLQCVSFPPTVFQSLPHWSILQCFGVPASPGHLSQQLSFCSSFLFLHPIRVRNQPMHWPWPINQCTPGLGFE